MPATQYQRVAVVGVPPEAYCLLETLRELADGRGVTYIVEDIPMGTSHRFNYMRSKWHFTLSFVAQKSSEATIRHSSGVANKNPEQLPKVREWMLETEALLRNRCGLAEAMDSAQESCLGPACYTIGLQLNR